MGDQSASGTHDELHRSIWTELARAVQDRSHSWRTPVLATLDESGVADARTVVLRSANPVQQRLILYTDSRSAKTRQLQKAPEATLVFWSEALSWQLRTYCRATVIDTGAEVDRVWEGVSSTRAAAEYLGVAQPGSPLTLFELAKSGGSGGVKSTFCGYFWRAGYW